MCAARVKGGREEATYEYSCRQGRTRRAEGLGSFWLLCLRSPHRASPCAMEKSSVFMRDGVNKYGCLSKKESDKKGRGREGRRKPARSRRP